jgi:hypothetical protein
MYSKHMNNEPPHITVEQLENMTTHQLAQLLSDLTKVLLRMPDEQLKNLKRAEAPTQVEQLSQNIRQQKDEQTRVTDLPDWLS